MGRLKWDVETVHQALDELEVITQGVEPIQTKIDRKARKLRKMKHLPQYVTQRLENLITNNSAMADRTFASVRSVRSALPEIERKGKKKRYPALVEGEQYRVALGGAFLTRKATSQYAYYSHDESKNLHVGDIVTYRGFSQLEGKKEKADLFELADFGIGAFHPHTSGRAKRVYLEKTRKT